MRGGFQGRARVAVPKAQRLARRLASLVHVWEVEQQMAASAGRKPDKQLHEHVMNRTRYLQSEIDKESFDGVS